MHITKHFDITRDGSFVRSKLRMPIQKIYIMTILRNNRDEKPIQVIYTIFERGATAKSRGKGV